MPDWLSMALMVFGPFILAFLILVFCFADGLDSFSWPPKWPWQHRW